jgi:hypothetical protein
MGDEGANHPLKKDPDAVRESLKSGFETVKQLTTLSAGSTVLLATFLKDIFPGDLANLTVRVKVVVVFAFSLLTLSPMTAISSLVGFSGMLRSRRLNNIESDEPFGGLRMRYRGFIAGPLFLYSVGLILFSFAVLDALLEFSPLVGMVVSAVFLGFLPAISLGIALWFLFRGQKL